MAEEKNLQNRERDTQELIRAVRDYQNGNMEAFNTIYEFSCRYLYVCICNIIGNEDESCDILQNTYMDIAKSIGSLNQAESFLSWAGVIARRECYAHMKKNKNAVPIDSDDEIFESLEADESFIPENVMQDKEKQRLIREVIDGLSQMQRLCIMAYYFEGKKQEEIAQELGIPLNSVKSNILRAKAKIKEKVLTIEKEQGTKLYSIAPLLLLLLDEEIAECILPDSLQETVMKQAGVPYREAVKKAALEAAKKTVQTKFIIGAVAAAAVIGGGIALFYQANAGNALTAGSNLAQGETAYETVTAPEQNAAAQSASPIRPLEEATAEEQTQEEQTTQEQTAEEQSDEETVFEAVMDFSEFEGLGNAHGNVIPVKKDGLWGAVNYQKKEIVPCEYTGFWAAPDSEGTFILTNSTYNEYGMEDYTYYIFNRDGKLLYESGADDDKVTVSGGLYCVADSIDYDDTSGEILGRVSYYKADGTMIYSEPCEVTAMSTNGFRDGYALVCADYEDESKFVGKIGKMDKDGNVTWHEMYVDSKEDSGSYIQQAPMNSFNHGYCVLRNEFLEAGMMTMISDNFEELAQFNIFFYQLQGDTLVYDERYFHEDNISWERYQIDGAFYSNYGSKMVLTFDDRDVLVDLSLYPGMTYENADGRIVQAVYDTIVLSEETYWLACDGERWGYIDHDGRKMQFYDDASEFCNGKALVMEDGMAYLINENFEKIKELGAAEGISWRGDFFVVYDGESRQLYPVDG